VALSLTFLPRRCSSRQSFASLRFGAFSPVLQTVHVHAKRSFDGRCVGCRPRPTEILIAANFSAPRAISTEPVVLQQESSGAPKTHPRRPSLATSGTAVDGGSPSRLVIVSTFPGRTTWTAGHDAIT
jgi:hypothetical protein